MPERERKTRKLAVLNRRIVRLSAELETLQFMQDRLERQLEPGGTPQGVSSSPRRSRNQNGSGGAHGRDH